MTTRRPSPWVALAASLVFAVATAAGCSSDGPRGVAGGPGTAGATTTVTTGASSDMSTTSGGVATLPAPSLGSPGAPSEQPSAASTAAEAARATVAAPAGPGSYATRYLRGDGPARITIAALVQRDAAPQAGTLEHIQQALEDASGKQVDVSTTTLGDAAPSWTEASLESEVDRNAPRQSGDVAILSLLFVNGDFRGDSSILGVATRGDFAAIFVDQVRSSAGLFGAVGPIERSVSTHEVGHVLGLVDLVLQTGRGDPAHPGHSTNQASVMYWAVESDVIGQLFGAQPPTEFDAADEADLAALRAS